ncbi:hypothetical protein Salat_1577700 [Sesamum alatum]|uniref:Uncharacterized protein n=2 Tax=Sesamum alatum TaxID=300844 RepID=A0AAE2CMX5_9LAMI|nr:hypothetical protein Salat_1577700 [Sesamum alatum]
MALDQVFHQRTGMTVGINLRNQPPQQISVGLMHPPAQGRGRSKPLVRWNSGVKLQLELTSNGKIDGPDRVAFKTQLGVMARNSYRFPLIYTSFRQIPEHLLDDLWNEIKENTTLPDEAKSVVIEDFSGKWKQGKYEVKKNYFMPCEDDEERLDTLSVDSIPPEQLKAMIGYWKLEKTKAEAQRNAQNIAQYKFPHQLGRTPILELEKQLLIEGIESSRLDIFYMSRSRNGKPPPNEETSKLINQLRETTSQVSEVECTRELKEMVFTEFMGVDSRGRVRCAGQGVKPSQYRHTLSSNDAIKKKIREEVVQEVKEEMREEREQMRKEIEEMREEKEQMKRLMEQMAKKIAQTRAEMTQEVVEDVVSYFGLGGFPMAPFQTATTSYRPTVQDLPSTSGASSVLTTSAIAALVTTLMADDSNARSSSTLQSVSCLWDDADEAIRTGQDFRVAILAICFHVS